MRYRSLHLLIVHARGIFWLYTLISVYLCMISNPIAVVNVFLSVLHIFANNVYTPILCYDDFRLLKIS